MRSKTNISFFGLRIVAGILALLAIWVSLSRFIFLHGLADVDFLGMLRVIFPLSVGLLFGYTAMTGKLPFALRQRKADQDHH